MAADAPAVNGMHGRSLAAAAGAAAAAHTACSHLSKVQALLMQQQAESTPETAEGRKCCNSGVKLLYQTKL